MNGQTQTLTIDLISIQLSKSLSQIHNAKVLPRKFKAVHLGRVAEQRP